MSAFMQPTIVALAVLSLLSFAHCQSSCPPRNFDSVADLNLTKYMLAAPWYVQERQMLKSYPPEDELFCVRAKYTALDPQNLKAGFIVENYFNKGGVDLQPGGSSGAGGSNCSDSNTLLVFPVTTYNSSRTSPTDTSKLLLGPSPVVALQRPELLGDYWVVAVGVSSNETLGYDWAIVSAGAPGVNSNGGCRTGAVEEQGDGAGLWFFSRTPDAPTNTQAMKQAAQDLGYDVSQMFPVKQQGCNYINADSACLAEAALLIKRRP